MGRREKKRLPLAAPGALLLSAMLVYHAEGRLLAALLPAVLVHELGHLLALRLLGLHVRALRPEATGLRIDYAGGSDAADELLAAAAGPAAGLCYAWGLLWLSARQGWEGARLSAELSLLLSLFNLLPALPLDGGRIVTALLSVWPGGERGARTGRILSLVTALLLCAAGAYLLLRRRGAAMLISGGVLLAEQIKR